MSSLIEIRKAFEAPLKVVVAAYSPVTVGVRWPTGQTFVESDYLMVARPTLHMAPERPRTMGPNPAVQGAGHYHILCKLKSGQPWDLLDDFVQAVLDAYPYDTDLTAGGRKIQIDSKSAAAPVEDDGWVYRFPDLIWSMNI